MNKTLKLIAGLMLGGFMGLTSARAQAVYATPYTFVTIAGTANTSSSGPVDGTNGAAQFGSPVALTVDTNGNLYVLDNLYNDIRKVSPQGTNWVVTTIAGSASGGSGSNDGTNEDAQFYAPNAIARDAAGNLYVADGLNNTIRKITPLGTNWVVSTIAGNSQNGGGLDGTNTGAQFDDPSGIAVDSSGNLYVADTYGDSIRKVVHTGTNWVVTTIAGSFQGRGSNDGTNGAAQFFLPASIAVDGSDRLYVADGNSTIREIVPQGTNWVVTTIAGSGGASTVVDGTNTDTVFNGPQGIALDASTNLYVADTGNSAIREVMPVGTNWVTTTLAGADDGTTGTNDGTGPLALFSNPYGVAVDASGHLFVADTGNGTIREGFIAGVPNPTITLIGSSTVMVSWPGPGGTLQTNSNLSTANWGVYGGTINSSNGTNSVTLPASGGILFFRLTQ